MRATSQNRALIDVLRIIAPGTKLREGLDNIMRAKTGGLIVIGEPEVVLPICHGGFEINTEFTSYKIYELAKMDGAIVLSPKAEKIIKANVELIPDSNVMTLETGIRHRTAERVAKQSKALIISISQRRGIITVYKDFLKYIVQDTNRVLTKANQAIQTLEKYRVTLDSELVNLSALEIEDVVTIHDVANVIKRSEMVLRVADEIERYIIELGDEGNLIQLQLDELVSAAEKDLKNVISDYAVNFDEMELVHCMVKLATLNDEDLLSGTHIAKLLGYSVTEDLLDLQIYPRGYRMLANIPRLPLGVIKNILNYFDDLQGVLTASMDELEEVEGVGAVRAQNIVLGLKRIQERAFNHQTPGN